jgi:hypothetical protein
MNEERETQNASDYPQFIIHQSAFSILIMADG